jgi:hypothetical protein
VDADAGVPLPLNFAAEERSERGRERVVDVADQSVESENSGPPRWKRFARN